MFNDTPGTTIVMQHPIPIGDTPPITSQPYRIPAKWKEQLEQEVASHSGNHYTLYQPMGFLLSVSRKKMELLECVSTTGSQILPPWMTSTLHVG